MFLLFCLQQFFNRLPILLNSCTGYGFSDQLAVFIHKIAGGPGILRQQLGQSIKGCQICIGNALFSQDLFRLLDLLFIICIGDDPDDLAVLFQKLHLFLLTER